MVFEKFFYKKQNFSSYRFHLRSRQRRVVWRIKAPPPALSEAPPQTVARGRTPAQLPSLHDLTFARSGSVRSRSYHPPRKNTLIVTAKPERNGEIPHGKTFRPCTIRPSSLPGDCHVAHCAPRNDNAVRVYASKSFLSGDCHASLSQTGATRAHEITK